MKKGSIVVFCAFLCGNVHGALVTVGPWTPIFQGVDLASGQQQAQVAGEENHQVLCLPITLTSAVVPPVAEPGPLPGVMQACAGLCWVVPVPRPGGAMPSSVTGGRPAAWVGTLRCGVNARVERAAPSTAAANPKPCAAAARRGQPSALSLPSAFTIIEPLVVIAIIATHVTVSKPPGNL